MSGALAGLKVVELANEVCAFAGKLLADMGAEVVRVEPPGGDATRGYEPFFEDKPGIERSLVHWHYNTSKRGVTLDVESERGRELFRKLVGGADLLIEGERPGRMASLELGYAALQQLNPRLIMVSITPFGQDAPRADEEATDLTIFGGGGPAWMNGYDDHSLPPVRGGGTQAYHTGCHFGVMSALVALLERDISGEGQYIDVSMHAAANVTTEAGSYTWLVSQETVQRQTGRHAAVNPTMNSQIVCADGRYVNTGVPPRTPRMFKAMHEWLTTLGLLEEFGQGPLLEMGANRDRIDLGQIAADPEVAAIFGAGRDAMNFIAERISAYEFFSQAQARSFQVGIIYSPEEAIADPHFVARGFPVEVEHPELGRSFTYPGAPYKLMKSPWSIRRRAPLLGEDNEAVFGEIGVSAEELAKLKADGVV